MVSMSFMKLSPHTAELSGCDGDHVTHKPEIFTTGPLQKKNFANPCFTSTTTGDSHEIEGRLFHACVSVHFLGHGYRFHQILR